MEELQKITKVENIRKSINEFLSKHRETLRKDIFGNHYAVNSREERRKIFGEESILSRFDLASLMPTYKKRWKTWENNRRRN